MLRASAEGAALAARPAGREQSRVAARDRPRELRCCAPVRRERSIAQGGGPDLRAHRAGVIRATILPMESETRWKYHGVRVVRAGELDTNTPQTPGMNRAAAITHARAGAEKLWAGTVVIHPKAKTGAHHHGPVESVIYVVSGRARMRWGDKLEYMAEAGPGDFIYVPPYVPHQEINANDDQPLSCVLVRSGQEPVVVNLDIPMVEKPEEVHWVDNIHPAPGN
jgi:uncharacterized RmlC-like cupin family protein